MVYLLRAFSYETLEAHDGPEGIEKARREKPDLILLDIHMPRMDGYEVARNLNVDPECAGIPIVAVTALAMVGDREKILASGFSGYIAKPLDPAAFPMLVQGFLGEKKRAEPRSPTYSETSEATARQAPRQKRGVVLFVDNSETNISLIRGILEPSGFDVVVAHSASEGLKLAKTSPPDLILSDVHMPHQDGYDFRRMVQSEPELCKTPFIFLSSSVWSRQEQEHALRTGATKFLSRPIEPHDLLAEIESCLPKGEKI
jgi:two-component system, cell cycle response regulator